MSIVPMTSIFFFCLSLVLSSRYLSKNSNALAAGR